MSHPTAERARTKYYRYGEHVVKIVKVTDEEGNVTETLSVTRHGNKAAALRGGHSYARLPKRWRAKIREEVQNRV